MSVLGRTQAVALDGLAGAVVEVEAHLSQAMPAITIVGLPDTACRQASERVRAAAANTGLTIPDRRITVNLSPASLPKSGSAFDVAIAVAILTAGEMAPAGVTEGVVHIGELSLEGRLRPVRGVLPLVLAAVRAGHHRVIVPYENAAEAALVTGAQVVPARTLEQVVAYHWAVSKGQDPQVEEVPAPAAPPERVLRDLADVAGQSEARLALEIAAAGGHHLFLLGPPGAGKTMLAECLPGLLPPLNDAEALQATAVQSVLGELKDGALVRQPPFVAPHHGATQTAVIGGGSGDLRPGLISMAHHGVLFLDEAGEFKPGVLQALRQPLESGQVMVARARATRRFPARFQLVLASNPCPCGNAHGKGRACRCTPKARRDYLGRLAGPLLDRVDLQLHVEAVSRAALTGRPGESSGEVRRRVLAARARQAARLEQTPWALNAQVPGPVLRQGQLRLPPQVTVDLDRALERSALTLRGYDRVLRLAWTIGDLAGAPAPGRDDIGLALTLRTSAAVAA